MYKYLFILPTLLYIYNVMLLVYTITKSALLLLLIESVDSTQMARIVHIRNTLHFMYKSSLRLLKNSFKEIVKLPKTEK